MWNPEGEADRRPLRPCFDRRLKLEFHGSRVTSDAGLLAYRELDDALGLTALAGDVLADSRMGKNGWHGVVGLLRQSVYGRLAGYEDVNDAERLGRDPAMRWIVGGKAVERGGASASQMGRFETELLANDENLTALTDLSGVWIDRVHARKLPRMIVLDMDSSVSPTHGDQEGTAYNGHFGCTCYHPLFVFNQFGDLERCALRPGNVHSAHEWRDVLEPVVARYRDRTLRRYFRGDAAFASPEVYEFLEAEDFSYAIRLLANKVLQGSIADLLSRFENPSQQRPHAPVAAASRTGPSPASTPRMSRAGSDCVAPRPSSQRHAAATPGPASRRLRWPPSSSSCAPDPTRQSTPIGCAFIPKYHMPRVNDRPRAQPMASAIRTTRRAASPTGWAQTADPSPHCPSSEQLTPRPAARSRVHPGEQLDQTFPRTGSSLPRRGVVATPPRFTRSLRVVTPSGSSRILSRRMCASCQQLSELGQTPPHRRQGRHPGDILPMDVHL